MFNILFFILINFLIIINSYLLVKEYLKVTSIDTVIITLLLFFAHIVFVNTFLGIIGKLEYTNIIFCLLLILLFETLAMLKRGKFIKINQVHISIFDKNDWLFSIILSFLLILLFNLFVWGLITPPPVGGDAFTYHLVFPVSWLKAKKIYIHPTPFGDQAPAYAPSNVELLYLWFISPFNEDFLTNIGQFLFFIIGSISLYSICVKLGIVNELALLPSLTFLFTPGLIRQSTIADVDVIFASLFIISVNLLLLYKINHNFPTLICLSISLGLFLGTKFISIPYSIFLIIPVILLIFKEFKKFKVFIAKLSIVGFFVLVFCGYWYLRNFFVTGSFVYPLSLKFLGYTLMKGAYDRQAMLNSYYHITTPKTLFHNWNKEIGIGLGVLIPISFFNLLHKLLLKKTEKDIFKYYIFLLPFLIFLSFWFLIPYNSQTRFLFPAIGILYLFIPFFFEIKSNSKIKFLLKLFIYASILLSNIQNNHIFIVSKEIISVLTGFNKSLLNNYKSIIVIFWCLPLLIFILNKNKNFKIRLSIFLIMLVLFAFGLHNTKLTHEKYKYNWYTKSNLGLGWLLINKISEKPLNIAYAGNNVPYGLYGSRLKNNVFYINTSEDVNWKWHDFAKKYEKMTNFSPPNNPKPAYYRRDCDFKKWLSNMQKANIDILFISTLHPHEAEYIWHDEERFPIEKNWAEKHPQYFREIYRNEDVRIFLTKL